MQKFFLTTVLFALFFTCSLTVSAQQDVTKAALLNTYAQDDSSKAIINLFYRKRRGALIRGLVGGGLAGYSAGSALSSGNTSGVLIGPIVFSPLWITSITGANKYKQHILLDILELHRQGDYYPEKYAKKLRRRDFKN